MAKLNHIRVKTGVLDEEIGNDMGGWSGRVIGNENDLLTIEWDGPTLRRIPDAMIRHGILVNGHKPGPNSIVVPLADLEGLDTQKENTKLLEWYRVWFANR
jgi:hypothetical protein